jgi:hypothetical protein
MKNTLIIRLICLIIFVALCLLKISYSLTDTVFRPRIRSSEFELNSFYHNSMSCVPKSVTLSPRELLYDSTSEYGRLSKIAESTLDSSKYFRYDYSDPQLRTISCASTPRFNTLNSSFVNLARYLFSVERIAVSPSETVANCKKSQAFSSVWSALEGSSPPTMDVFRSAADLTDQNDVLSCRPGFAAAQRMFCGLKILESLSDLPLASIANCLVRLAAAWSAMHSIVSYSDSDDSHLRQISLLNPPGFARLFDVYMEEYIQRTRGFVETRDLVIKRIFSWDIPAGIYPSTVIDALEPIEPTLRNMLFGETGSVIAFKGYKVLPSLKFWTRPAKAILVDVGINAFMASPKALLDMYESWLHFDEVILIEPKANKLREVPPDYINRYPGIQIKQVYTEVGTGNRQLEVIHVLKSIAEVQDFVVLKYDVDVEDHCCAGSTLEWGFLHGLLNSNSITLVDELFIELHFWAPEFIAWKFDGHSMWEAFDVMRQLRQKGHAVHAWP